MESTTREAHCPAGKHSESATRKIWVAVNLLSLAGLQCTGGAADFLDASTQHLEVVLVQQCWDLCTTSCFFLWELYRERHGLHVNMDFTVSIIRANCSTALRQKWSRFGKHSSFLRLLMFSSAQTKLWFGSDLAECRHCELSCASGKKASGPSVVAESPGQRTSTSWPRCLPSAVALLDLQIPPWLLLLGADFSHFAPRLPPSPSPGTKPVCCCLHFTFLSSGKTSPLSCPARKKTVHTRPVWETAQPHVPLWAWLVADV